MTEGEKRKDCLLTEMRTLRYGLCRMHDCAQLFCAPKVNVECEFYPMHEEMRVLFSEVESKTEISKDEGKKILEQAIITEKKAFNFLQKKKRGW